MLVPAPWRGAFGAGETLQNWHDATTVGRAAAIGKTALVGTQMAVDRISKVRRH